MALNMRKRRPRVNGQSGVEKIGMMGKSADRRVLALRSAQLWERQLCSGCMEWWSDPVFLDWRKCWRCKMSWNKTEKCFLCSTGKQSWSHWSCVQSSAFDKWFTFDIYCNAIDETTNISRQLFVQQRTVWVTLQRGTYATLGKILVFLKIPGIC